MKKLNDKNSELVEKIINVIHLEKGLSKNTKTAYKSDILLIFNWFNDNKINAIEAHEHNFRELFSFLQSKNFKSSSLSRKLSSLKQFYQILKEEGYIQINPLNNLESLYCCTMLVIFRFNYTLTMFFRSIYQALWISYLINYFISCTKKEIFVLCRF